MKKCFGPGSIVIIIFSIIILVVAPFTNGLTCNISHQTGIFLVLGMVDYDELKTGSVAPQIFFGTLWMKFL